MSTNIFPDSSPVPSDLPIPLPEEVVVVGGGRWGQIHCRVLNGFGPELRRVHLVSANNYEVCQTWIANAFFDEVDLAKCRSTNGDSSCREVDKTAKREFVVWRDLDEMLRHASPTAGIIANRPSDHFAAAKQLLSAGVNLLVEKPLTPTVQESDELIELAKRNNLVLNVGHEYLVASYVHYLRECIQRKTAGVDAITRMELFWHDVAIERRSGLRKRPDLTTNAATDLLSHLLSIAVAVKGPASVRVTDATTADGGMSAEVAMDFGNATESIIPTTASFSRLAESTRREAVFQIGDDSVSLNFSSEPATVRVNGVEQPVDPRWDTSLKPLNAEAAHLFLQIAESTDSKTTSNWPLLAENNHEIFQATDEVDRRLTMQQEATLADCIASGQPPGDAVFGLRQHLAGPLFDQDVIHDPKDHDTINEQVDLAFQIIETMANRPFTTQRQIADKLAISTEHLARLNHAIRNTPLAQQLMLCGGRGAKYLSNTIIPILRSGSIRHSLDGKASYPYRVGVYTGQSCMFYCTFCGRNHSAKYASNDVLPGNELLEQIFRDAPKDDPNRFYLSGGLEPLTNRGLGDLIQCGAEQGFRLSLYTNGFMLTPALLEKQPGIWDLASLRISFYGVDAETTQAVTQKPKSFEQVVRNAKSFLRLRNERGSDLQFGFNFVMLTGKTDQLLQLADVLAEINRDAGGRQIDFLTLREDYSVTPDEGISDAERQKLVSTFEQFEERLSQDDLCELNVDYGYSLHALRKGYSGQPLEMATSDEMRPAAYPQVSVVVDLLGDVYAYREAGFLDRAGADRYIIGRITPEKGLDDVVREFVESGAEIDPLTGDTAYFDIFDHVVTKVINQAEDDRRFDIPFSEGPIVDRTLAEEPDQRISEFANAHFARVE